MALRSFRMDTAGFCPKCRRTLPPDSPGGLCPSCLFRAGLDQAGEAATLLSGGGVAEDVPSPEPGDGRRFGDYELIEKLARGGMGVVYRARDFNTGRIVALKMILSGRHATEMELVRFRAEAEAAANLEHPNIVPIYEFGEVHEIPYYTMKLMEGGSLAGHVDAYRADPRAAARLMATIAWAVHFAHQRGIIHRDLKPANILMDAQQQPQVSDFTLAKHVGRDEGITQTGAIFGTPSYMAPEQAEGKTKSLTVAVDVYALGAILYELLSGRPPFTSESAMDTIRKVVEEDPPPPSTFGQPIDRDLETICLKCLEKDPHRRYGSAEDVGKELERYLKGQPIKARYLGRAQRIWRWCLRFPLWAAGLASAAVFLVVMTLGGLVIARAQQQARLRDVLSTNVFAARHVAVTVLWQLSHYGQAVQHNAGDAELRGLLMQRDRLPADLKRLDQIVRRFHEQSNAAGGPYRRDERADIPFESWFVLDAEGVGVARCPESKRGPWVGERFAGREYFQQALVSTNGTPGALPHVSRVFQSLADGYHKFSLAVPIKASDDPAAPVLGVLVTTITTDSTLGAIPLGDSSRKVVLAGRVDTNPRQSPATAPAARADYVILVDQGYPKRKDPAHIASGAFLNFAGNLHPGRNELSLPREAPPAVGAASDADYIDPVSGGRYLAGFAQVGNSELVVVVQTPYSQALQQDKALALNLGFWFLGVIVIDSLIFAAAAYYAHRKGMLRLG